MTMRERLAIAALCGWNNVPRDNVAMLAEWQKRTSEPGSQPTKAAWERVVDSVLEELMIPTQSMKDAAKTEMVNVENCLAISALHGVELVYIHGEPPLPRAYRAMLIAAKDGK